MGEKKQSVRPWYKILAIAGCILFVVLMVVSSMGTGWITAFSSVKPGDITTIDFTIRDRNGYPIVTSDQQVYRQTIQGGGNIFYSKQLVFQANQSSIKSVVPVPVYTESSGWLASFALFAAEHDAISNGIIGMKQNEIKTVSMPGSNTMTQYWSSVQMTSQGVNFTDVRAGDKLSMAVSDNPELSKNATESSYSVRIGEVMRKSPDGVTVDFGYPSVDVRIVSINRN